MQHHDPEAVEREEAAPLPPREPTSALGRRAPPRLNKLIWLLTLGVAGVLVYGLFATGSDRKASGNDVPEVETLRPAPRLATRPAPEPLFVPTQVAASAPTVTAQSVPPLPPDTPLPPVDPAQLNTADRRAAAADEAAEAARRRRMAPLLVTSGALGKVDAVLADSAASVVMDVLKPKSSMVDAALADRPADAARDASSFVPTALEPDDASLDRKILQGKSIPAVLETPIHTALPGQVRAMVDEDVYGESGRRVLIPKMSRLVGEYETARISAGQSRVMVMWQRALLPDGTSVSLASPGTDGLGRSGMSGVVDNHYLERFGAAFLVSMIGVAVEDAAASNQRASNSAGGLIIVDRTRSEAVKGLQSTVESILKSQANIPPTIQVVQGSRVRVLVARDLDLSAVSGKARRPRAP
ncbi:TrbI/VirB10 family protein [Hydrogenophaga sp.]|uniref:TrbI/VirB10 family protein n=1 Tax=Hydrogenophaga sp. TaxID=1904254 RepID=UPI003F6EE202